jgi:outer membrane protein
LKRIYFIIILLCFLCLNGIATAQQISLEDAFEKAIKGNPSLKAIQERILRAEKKIDQAKALYYPFVDVKGSVTRNEMSSSDINSSFIPADRIQGFYDSRVSAKWIIFSGFFRKYSTLGATLNKDIQVASLEDEKRNLLFSVAKAYHTAQLALSNKAISDSNRVFFQEQFDNAKIKRTAGVGSLSDVLNFNTQVNQAEIEMERFQSQHDISNAVLASLLGIEADTAELPGPVFPEKEKAIEMVPPKYKVIVSDALGKRPDLKRFELAVAISKANIGKAKARFFPELSLLGSMGADRTGSGRFEHDDIENSFSLQLSYPLFAGGGNRAALKEAQHAYNESKLKLKNFKINIISQVRQGSVSVAAAQKQLLLYRENEKLIKQNRDMVAKEYEFGTTSLVNLNEVQARLSTTQQRIVLSLISLRQAWYELKSASGDIYYR